MSAVRQLRLLVVKHEADAGLGQLGDRLRQLPVEVVTVGPDTELSVPDQLTGFDGLIVLGGAMGPRDDDIAPWLPATRKLLSDAVTQQLPTLGICLGAQLLATATGGNVRRMPDGPEVGLKYIELTEEASSDPLLGGFTSTVLPVVQWHWLEADELPIGAQVLASSPACTNQAYRLGERAWGLQFHPEALGDTALDWTGVEDLPSEGLDPDAVVREVREAESELRQTWQQLIDRFVGLLG